MPVENNLTALLKNVCARTFTDFAPVATARPYITFQQLGGDVLSYIDRVVPNKENGEYQINVWADTRAEAVNMIKLIEVLLIEATAFQAAPVSARRNDFDADIPVYGSSQDFSIWSDR
jgi:hypothetical protein